MPEPIYFQWQNPFLLDSIYPLRETKLRDFLVFFYEIDIWDAYKKKPAPVIETEVRQFRAAQKGRITAVYERYQQLLAYFLMEDVAADYRRDFSPLDDRVMAQINAIHKSFKTYFPRYKNPAQERYFASARVRELEDAQKRVAAQISEHNRMLRGGDWPGRTKYQAELDNLTAISVEMLKREMKTLLEFVGVYERLYQYRQAALKQKAASDAEIQAGTGKLTAARAELDALQAKLNGVQASLNRLKVTPNAEALKAHFLNSSAADTYKQRLGELDQQVYDGIKEVHRAFGAVFPGYNKNAVYEKSFISQRLGDLDKLSKNKQLEQQTAARMANTSKAALLITSLKALNEEMVKLNDYLWWYEIQGKPAGFYSAQIAQAEKDQLDLQNKVRAAQASISAIEVSLNQARAISGSADQNLILAAVDNLPVSAKDLALNAVEDFKAALKDKKAPELLELVVQEFMRSPTRYPLWLQYMVIHFSGMRYQSAHGSWADPKDMLLALRTPQIEQELREAGEKGVQMMCDERYQCYRTGGSAPVQDGEVQARVPALAATSDPYWKKRINEHLEAINPVSWQNKFRALLNLKIDEEDYEISLMKTDDALEQLKDFKGRVPDWMWNEIVRCTTLRVTEVSKKEWETATQEELELSYAAKMAPYREILLKWKKENLTGWREEHDRVNELIVTRAVCNEVAEHIQHIRGRSPYGGLTAKPDWYKRMQTDPRLSRVPDAPYLRKAKEDSDFRPGASILWLNWVNKQPNQWQIAVPVQLVNKEELVLPQKDAQNEIINTGSAFLRNATFTETAPDGSKYTRTSQQWLRWMHEATVVTVADTPDGLAVLTFETALPGEDRRQSTIGVFKRYAAHLKYNVTASAMNGVFVGYVPEGAVPYENLNDMLNWNHILQRQAYTQPQIDAYWKQVEKPIDPSIAFEAPFTVEIPMEIAPRLEQRPHREFALCYERDRQTRELLPYQPVVELRRGARLAVTKSDAVQVDGVTYYMVTRCDYQPRAQDLLVRADELVTLPEKGSYQPAKARKDVALYRICGADEQQRPVFEESPVRLKAGTRLLLSTVHKASPADAGDGIVRGQGRQGYSLIIACPGMPEAEGMFIKRGEQRKVN